MELNLAIRAEVYHAIISCCIQEFAKKKKVTWITEDTGKR
jgi:hypothetical protein